MVFYKSCDLIGTESGQYPLVRPAHSARYPIRYVLSRLEHLAAFRRMFRSRHLADKLFINSLFSLSPSLSLSLSLSLTQSNFVLANYELLNGLSQGLNTVCNLTILHKKQIRKSKNVRYLFTITITSINFLKLPKKLVRFKTPSNDLSSTICYEYTFVECLQVR